MHFSDLTYDCLQCGKGCRVNWRIPVAEALIDGLENSRSGEAVRARSYVPVEVLDDQPCLGHTASDECVFLSNNLCSIHAEKGPEAKPHQCRQFPFLPISTPDGMYVGLSFFCTAIQQQHGRPNEVHEPWLRELLRPEPGASSQGESRVTLGPGSTLKWSDYLQLEAKCQQWLLTQTPREASFRMVWTLLLLHEQMKGQTDYSCPLEAAAATSPPAEFTEFMETIRRSFLSLLISMVEFPPGIGRTQSGQALARGEQVECARLGRISVPSETSLAESLTGAVLPEARRYLGHRLFGKFLLQGDTLLSYAGILWAIVAALEFYTVQATPAGESASPQHFWKALDVVETELITHGSGADCMGPLLRDTLIRCFDTLPAHSKRPESV